MSDSDQHATTESGFTLIGEEKSTSGAMPRIDFSTFALSLFTSGRFHLGEIPDPITGQAPEKDLILARHTVETLEMLQEKTTGNLTPEEAKLMSSLIYDLKMKIVEGEK